MGIERRESERYTVDLPARIKCCCDDARVLNLSLKGALLLACAECSIWDEVTVDIDFTDSCKKTLKASVAWSEGGIMGVSFALSSSEEQKFLENYLSDLARQQEPEAEFCA